MLPKLSRIALPKTYAHAKLDRACAAAYTEATPSFVMPQSASLAGRVMGSGEEPQAIRSLPVAGQDGGDRSAS